MANEVPADSGAVTVVTHPSEHGPRRSSAPAQAGGCCTCCCCCCLHTVGGIVGAVIAPKLGGRPKDAWSHLSLVAYWDEDEYTPGSSATSKRDLEAVTEEAPSLPTGRARERDESDTFRADVGDPRIALLTPRRSAASLFWWTMLVLVLVGMLISCLPFVGVDSIVARIALGGILLLLALPGVQLGAAFVTGFILAVSDRPDKSYQFRQLGKITLGVVAGTLSGFLLMVGIYVGFARELAIGFAPWVVVSVIIDVMSVFGLVVLSKRR